MSTISKLTLGTVQFGLDYGINNSNGQVQKSDVRNILNYCVEVGIDTLDTAYAYGDSEVILGENDLTRFKLISKLPICASRSVEELFIDSQSRLGVSALYGYMLHNFSIYKENKNIWNQLCALKESGRVKKIGVSLYSPTEFLELLEDGIDLDIVQIPYNLFDRRFDPYFSLFDERKIEVHTRSTFLQGLFFRPIKSLPDQFHIVRKKLEYFQSIVQDQELSTVDLCLGFVMSNSNIDKVVIGVDSLAQLENNVASAVNISERNFNWETLSFLEESELSILNPSLWRI